jgi:hypothetical protein
VAFSYLEVQGSAQPPAKKTAGLIEKETIKKAKIKIRQK